MDWNWKHKQELKKFEEGEMFEHGEHKKSDGMWSSITEERGGTGQEDENGWRWEGITVGGAYLQVEAD